MITEEGRGLLIDWDLPKDRDESVSPAERTVRAKLLSSDGDLI